jgi:hypothetical protein
MILALALCTAASIVSGFSVRVTAAWSYLPLSAYARAGCHGLSFLFEQVSALGRPAGRRAPSSARCVENIFMETEKRPTVEAWLRRRMRLPRHYTANDDASILLRLAGAAPLAALVLALMSNWVVARLALFAASAFAGLTLQQYAWYTGRVYAECWAFESGPVIGTAVLTSFILGGISLLFSMLLQGFTCIAVLGGLHLALLFSWRWVDLCGSLFDVRLDLCSHMHHTSANTHPTFVARRAPRNYAKARTRRTTSLGRRFTDDSIPRRYLSASVVPRYTQWCFVQVPGASVAAGWVSPGVVSSLSCVHVGDFETSLDLLRPPGGSDS